MRLRCRPSWKAKNPVGPGQNPERNSEAAGRPHPPGTGPAGGSALRELEALAGAGLAGLLAFLLARVAPDVAGLLQGGPELRVHLLQRARNPVRDRPGLARDAAAGHVGRHVDLLAKVDGQERGIRLLGEVVVREVPLELASVDGQLAGAVGDPDAGGGGLAAAGPGENVGRGAHGRVQAGILTGLLASCLCLGPANTRSFVSIFAARRFLGSMPLTACMITNSGRFSRISLRLR